MGRAILYTLEWRGLISARQSIGAVCDYLVPDTKDRLRHYACNRINDGDSARSGALPIYRHLGGSR